MTTQFRSSRADQERKAYDPYAHAITVNNEVHRMTHDGFVFYLQKSELDVPDGAVRTSLMRTGALPVHFRGFFIAASEGPVIIELYEDTVVDVLGTEDTPLNANRLSSNTPTARFYGSDTTFTAPGNPLLGGLYIPQVGNSGVSGGTLPVLEELVLKPNTDYQVSFENDPAGSGTADIVAQFAWYEIDYQYA